LTALNVTLGDQLETLSPVVRTFVLATIAVPIVIYGLMPHLHHAPRPPALAPGFCVGVGNGIILGYLMPRTTASGDCYKFRSRRSFDRVEWYLHSGHPQAVTELRREVVAYLGRHAEPESDLAGAQLVVAELLTNAFHHAPGPSWVRVEWGQERPRLEVHDLGPGFELELQPAPVDAIDGRGLFIANAFADDLARASKQAGGSKVTAMLPGTPPRRGVARSAAQPGEPVARSGGGAHRRDVRKGGVPAGARGRACPGDRRCGRGPTSPKRSWAQVGANVGQRMEDGYRAVRELTGRLDNEQIADLYIKLKAAIDGDFYVVDIDERRIVLGNRRCPFGEVVQRQPGLCRMTSSVFGGIAARNTGAAAVVLEERIALGDPECRVVVWLNGSADSRPSARISTRRSERPSKRTQTWLMPAVQRSTARRFSIPRRWWPSCATSCAVERR
jgi:anti-sigma regulatory factor (Ser/Thr protein kinase)